MDLRSYLLDWLPCSCSGVKAIGRLLPSALKYDNLYRLQSNETMPRCQNRTFNVYAIRCILEFSIDLEGYFLLIRNVQGVISDTRQCSNVFGPEGVNHINFL